MSTARSVSVTLVNQTDQVLSRGTFGLAGGMWGNGNSAVPPEQIAPRDSRSWSSVSNGYRTGTEGFANYIIGGNPSSTVNLAWDDPYAYTGANRYSGQCSDSRYQVLTQGGTGDNAVVVFTLKYA